MTASRRMSAPWPVVRSGPPTIIITVSATDVATQDLLILEVVSFQCIKMTSLYAGH